MLERCIIESPFAAPKHLRDELELLEKKTVEWFVANPEAVFGEPAHNEFRKTCGVPYYRLQEQVMRAERQHARYLKALALHFFKEGYAPFASHALYTQWLDDTNPEQRTLGMNAAFAWYDDTIPVFFGMNLGESPGMQWARQMHIAEGRTVKDVYLLADWDNEL